MKSDKPPAADFTFTAAAPDSRFTAEPELNDHVSEPFRGVLADYCRALAVAAFVANEAAK
jgi:hypothetical protein